MGAWGVGFYDNDDAADWMASLDGTQISDIHAIFEGIISDTNYIDVDQCNIALAAADCISVANKGKYTGCPEEVIEFADSIRNEIDSSIKYMALKTVFKIRDDRNSELKSLMSGVKGWKDGIELLLKRLG